MATALRKMGGMADAAIDLLIVEAQLKKVLPESAFSSPSPVHVAESGDFGGLFRSGESVVQVHIDEVTRKSVPALSHLGESFRTLRDRGFSGMFGDTQNERIVEFAKAHYNATVIDTPKKEAERAAANYAKHAEHHGFPKEYMGKPVKRVMIRF